MRPEELEKFHQRLLELREDLLSTREARDEASGTVHLDQQSVGRLSRKERLNQTSETRWQLAEAVVEGALHE